MKTKYKITKSKIGLFYNLYYLKEIKIFNSKFSYWSNILYGSKQNLLNFTETYPNYLESLEEINKLKLKEKIKGKKEEETVYIN